MGWSGKGEDGRLRFKGAANLILSTALKYLHIHTHIFILTFSNSQILKFSHPVFYFPFQPDVTHQPRKCGKGSAGHAAGCPFGNYAHIPNSQKRNLYRNSSLLLLSQSPAIAPYLRCLNGMYLFFFLSFSHPRWAISRGMSLPASSSLVSPIPDGQISARLVDHPRLSLRGSLKGHKNTP